MGVHGLWELLAPVGRRVSVETLAGKKLAIDASIWMVQFMKAMRDEKGEMVRNAHLIGFFRRICKLLYLKTKPVFVFDGGTPALKRRTVIARRRQRENAQAKIRKTAEKLLLNHLKTMRLKELAKDLENQRQKQNNASKVKILPDQVAHMGSNLERDAVVLASGNKGKLDETLPESIVAEKDESLGRNASTSGTTMPFEEDDDEDEEMILPTTDGNVDPAVLAALPPSMQHSLLVQKHDAKGKKILSDDLDQADTVRSDAERNHVSLKSYDHEKLDEMLAASIAAEEHGSLTNNIAASTASFPCVEEDDDEDEEMILPAMQGNVDPAVLAALPPSMQLDLLVQMRERLMAENRQKYQRVRKAPDKFSELQIQAYLKTVAFRREIDEVQKAAAGRGVGGIQTSRIASEANREFIFSSSFTGDKQVLASSKVGGSGDEQQQTTLKQSSNSLDTTANVPSNSKSTAVTELAPEETGAVFDDDVETYLDERGRVRVSRVRALGIRMTRDLQRNLDMMREIEHEGTGTNNITGAESMLDINKVRTPKSFSRKSKFVEISHDGNGESINLNERKKPSMLKNENIIEISFEENGESKCIDDNDDVFARLVSGDPVTIFSADDTPPKKQSSDSFSDSDWEEGIIEGKDNGLSNDVATEIKPTHNVKEGNISDESEVEWEEGPSGAPKSSSSCPAESRKTVPRGHLEEEANLQEAIRRSLLDLCGEKSDNFLSEHEKSVNYGENAYDGVELFDEKSSMGGPNVAGENATQQVEPIFDIGRTVGGVSNSQDLDSLDSQLKFSVDLDPKSKGILISRSREKCHSSHSEQSRQGESEESSLHKDAPYVESLASLELKELHFVKEKCIDDSNGSDRLSTYAKRCAEDNSRSSDIVSGDNMSSTVLVDNEKSHSESDLSAPIDDKERKHGVERSTMINDKKNDYEAELSCQKIVTSDPSSPVVDSCQNELSHGHFSGREHNIEKSEIKKSENMQVDFTEASLEDEMLILDQECMNLEDEQRKLERNAESVSSEMFAECQELLQMFGLPYIIAPMEAEAQCAYMELANLVDGVVTDDSDVFLFGGQSVYKNIFDDRKYVETYFMQDIEKELGLTREKLIRMALLLGSDYTEGISGIGIVNAIEVVNAFPEEDGLHKFREWIESPDPNILGKFDVQTGSNGRKRGSKVGDNDMKHTNNMEGLSEHGQKIKKIFMDNHRNVSKNWHIPSTFPSEAVISAYTSPQVDKSTEPFSWGKPDLFVLRRFCWDKFAWGSQKSDELLLPVLKEYEKRETQLRLEAFYTFNERFAKIRSKRIKKAVKAITGNQSSELTGEAKHEVLKSRKKRRVDGLESGNRMSEKAAEGSVTGTQNMDKSTPKQSRKRKVPEKSVSSKTGRLEQSITVDDQHNANKVSCGNEKGRDQRVGRGRGRQKLCAELLGTSSSDGAGGNNEQEVHAKKLEGPQKVRRSRRSQKPVNYSVSDHEIDDNVEAMEQVGNLGICGDASAGPSGKEQLIAGDTLPEGFSGDHLVRGGGFCTEEDETGQPSASQNKDLFSEAESTKDYLKMGGGFCADENDTCEDNDAAEDQLS